MFTLRQPSCSAWRWRGPPAPVHRRAPSGPTLVPTLPSLPPGRKRALRSPRLQFTGHSSPVSSSTPRSGPCASRPAERWSRHGPPEPWALRLRGRRGPRGPGMTDTGTPTRAVCERTQRPRALHDGEGSSSACASTSIGPWMPVAIDIHTRVLHTCRIRTGIYHILSSRHAFKRRFLKTLPQCF